MPVAITLVDKIFRSVILESSKVYIKRVCCEGNVEIYAWRKLGVMQTSIEYLAKLSSAW